ncbi:hypothetical protein BamMEX5DRAFT_5975 [Burkholderia ambifaria MEX-5]|uniref:Uncharacterized protein n=1 Tax=Burkholderia ambifaria MEX-5 TaxID=396597 RepID=B1TDV9_9BURK|nr:hypothetical protein BamMEX5DRAFT_5975 [Burkholderia ambifaria MEX-5]
MGDRMAACVVQPVQPDIFVPDAAGRGEDLDVEQRLDQLEQPMQHGLFGEVPADLVRRDTEALPAQVFHREGKIPRLQLSNAEGIAGEGLQGLPFGGRLRADAPMQIVQKRLCTFGGARHLLREREAGEISMAEQPGLLVPQGQQFGHDGHVVPCRRAVGIVFAQLGCPG